MTIVSKRAFLRWNSCSATASRRTGVLSASPRRRSLMKAFSSCDFRLGIVGLIRDYRPCALGTLVLGIAGVGRTWRGILREPTHPRWHGIAHKSADGAAPREKGQH